ncbi:MAG: hypothetical protein LUG91_00770 [Ruminococcus sp.]|nr:hypothetical protein [Ruminococcus sp.]MCD7810376.1 hypothetical protein [Ruminococcus sp.]
MSKRLTTENAKQLEANILAALNKQFKNKDSVTHVLRESLVPVIVTALIEYEKIIDAED